MAYDADLLLVNANVLTVDPARPRAGAVAVRGDRIAGVYDGEPGVRAANVIDLKGATLLPGFHDAHNHMIAREQGRLAVRVELMVASDALHPAGAHPADGIELGLDLGLRTGFGDDWLRLGPMKIFTDGSLIGRTAAMTGPYAGQPGNSGYLQADAAGLAATIVAAHRAGWRVAAHAIGDRAIDLALDAFETAAARYPGTDPRHRIEHFAASRPDQVIRASERKVVAVPQGRFATEFGDAMMAAVGPDRQSWLYRQRSLLDAGMVLPGSSDRPVAAGAPLLGIHDMVNRRAASGAPFNAAEAVTPAEAVRAYTYGSAYASKAEHVKGSVTPGKLADLVVVSEDPTAVSPGRIAGLEVLATIVGGEIAYSAQALLTDAIVRV